MATIPVQFYDNSNTATGIWTYNAFSETQGQSVAQLSADLKDDTNTATGVTLDVITAFTAGAGSASWAGAGAGVFPEDVLDFAWYTSVSSKLRLGGLNIGDTYSLDIVGNLSAGSTRHTDFTVDGTTERYTNSATSTPTDPVNFTGTFSGTTLDIDLGVVDSFAYINGFSLTITPASTGLTIDSTDATMQRNTDFQVVGSNPATTPSTADTLSNGGDTLTASSVVEAPAGTWTWTFPVGDLTKQVDATGYDWTLTVDAETVTTGNIPLTIQAGYTLVDLVDPVTTNASLLFGLTGDAPVTGDHLEYDVTSTLDLNVSLNVATNGVWTVTESVPDAWVTDITVSRRVVQANGTIGTEAVMTLSAPTSATSGLTIVTDMVSNIVSNMVN